MSRKAPSYEFEGAQLIRDEAREYMAELFPKARVFVQMATLETQSVGVTARIVGDPAPHAAEDIVECLTELGVQNVSRVEPGSATSQNFL